MVVFLTRLTKCKRPVLDFFVQIGRCSRTENSLALSESRTSGQRAGRWSKSCSHSMLLCLDARQQKHTLGVAKLFLLHKLRFCARDQHILKWKYLMIGNISYNMKSLNTVVCIWIQSYYPDFSCSYSWDSSGLCPCPFCMFLQNFSNSIRQDGMNHFCEH